MAMVLAMLSSAVLAMSANAAVPPPEGGDDRTAILAVVNALLDRLGTADGEQFREVLSPEGTIFIHNLMDPADPQLIVRSNTIMTEHAAPVDQQLIEKMGIPTVLQRGDMAHVWAPYAVWIEGEKTHCGMNSLSLSRSEGAWRVTNLSYTVEPTDRCAELGAPESPE